MTKLMPIEANTKTIQNCFRDCLYEVPNFQRPYSWEDTELSEYWDDVILAKSDFFFGTTVTWVSATRNLFRSTFSVIDGQQRLTTSIIALSVMRDAFRNLLEINPALSVEAGAMDRAERHAVVTQAYLIIQDDDGAQHPVMKRSEEMFWQHILEPSAIPSGGDWTRGSVRIGAARRFFENQVRAHIDRAITFDEAVEILKRFRNNILTARLIQVELSAEEDAFLVFETLNARGMELALGDLVKNMVMRGVTRGEGRAPDADAVSLRWSRLELKVVGAVEENHTVDDGYDLADASETLDNFIWQSWNSRRASVKQAEMYKAIKRSLSGRDGFHDYLGELEEDAETYQFLQGVTTNFPRKPQKGRSALSMPEVQNCILALRLFNVKVANSAVMGIVRRYNSDCIMKQRQLIRSVKAIENFHFQFTQLTTSGSTGGTRERYNKFAVNLTNASTVQEMDAVIDEFCARLKASLPRPELAQQAFEQYFYAPSVPFC